MKDEQNDNHGEERLTAYVLGECHGSEHAHWSTLVDTDADWAKEKSLLETTAGTLTTALRSRPVSCGLEESKRLFILQQLGPASPSRRPISRWMPAAAVFAAAALLFGLMALSGIYAPQSPQNGATQPTIASADDVITFHIKVQGENGEKTKPLVVQSVASGHPKVNLPPPSTFLPDLPQFVIDKIGPEIITPDAVSRDYPMPQPSRTQLPDSQQEVPRTFATPPPVKRER